MLEARFIHCVFADHSSTECNKTVDAYIHTYIHTYTVIKPFCQFVLYTNFAAV